MTYQHLVTARMRRIDYRPRYLFTGNRPEYSQPAVDGSAGARISPTLRDVNAFGFRAS